MTRFTSILALAAVMATPALAQDYIAVTTTANDGEGSLRAALAEAADSGAPVVVLTEGAITVSDTLSYDGTLPLTLTGHGQAVIMSENATVLAISNGADAMVSGLTLKGPGGFSIMNRGDLDSPAGKGIFVDVRDDQTGTVTLMLQDVAVLDVAGHGIHVSDCTLADDCGGGSGGAGEGSEASINVVMDAVMISNAGNGRFDADGLRVDERGEGSIALTVQNSRFEYVGADGIELDEGQAGSVYVSGSSNAFTLNGNYCDPAVLNSWLPSPDEGEFDEGAVVEDAIPGPVTGSPDDSCIEREVDLYDDGTVEEFAFGLDLDDGFDIDEAGPGGLVVTLSDSAVHGNLDEGIDFDEEGEGSIIATFLGGIAAGNTDDGYKLSEEDGGDVMVTVTGALALMNGGKGFVFEEADGGDVMVTVTGAAATGNDDMDDTGIEVVQEDDGMGAMTVTASDITDGIDAEGVEVN